MVKKQQRRQVTFKQELVDQDIILSVRHLKQFFTSGRGANKLRTKAVHDISFDIKKGEVFGLVGESSCGKTTTGRSIIKLYDVTSGSVYFKGYRINAGSRWNEKEIKWKTIRTNREIKRLKKVLKADIKQEKLALKQKIKEAELDILAKSNPELAAAKRELAALLVTVQERKNIFTKDEYSFKTKIRDLKQALRDEIRERSDDSQDDNDIIVAEINKKYEGQMTRETKKFEKARKQFVKEQDKDSKRILELQSVIKTGEKNLAPALKNELAAEKLVIATKVKAECDHRIAELKEATAKVIAELKANLAEIVKTQKEKIAQIRYDMKHIDMDIMNKMQMIFQDPIDSLNPRMTVEDIIQEGLQIQGMKNRAENSKKVIEALEKVGLISDYASRYPHEFSGGQRQRIGIARALIMNPEFIIADEPVSALDVSIRAQIINLLNDLRDELGLTILFIAHDLSVVKYFCDRIAVMYYGNIVELTTSDELFRHPLHPYTKALLSAIPKPDPYSEKNRERILYNPFTAHDYREEKPTLQEILPGHFVLANSEEMDRYRQEIAELDKKAAAEEAAENARVAAQEVTPKTEAKSKAKKPQK
ncbi:MAG: Oligopeptide transport ATP-binding protein OppF [Tenericutes bacterium ADurb.Bin087]|nr:MAG: Oligopeptide transport ATP-binding protein OppF [Tenericutes bacterium ADurb.Bin087]